MHKSLFIVSLILGSSISSPIIAAPWSVPGSNVPVPQDRVFPGTIYLQVDARNTMQRILRVKERIPVAGSGHVTLMHPQWDSGSHGPTIEVQRIAGLVVRGAGRNLAWRRDPLDPHAFHIEVPRGIDELDVDFQYLAPLGQRSPVSAGFISLQWQNVLLYPAGWFARRIPVEASVTLPQGMALGTALPVRSSANGSTTFAPVALDVLLDSPVTAAPFTQRRALGGAAAPVHVSYFASREADLRGADDMDAPLRAVVEQAAAVFGPAPFPRFDYVVALTDRLPGPGGLEHSRSADITMPADFLEHPEMYRADVDVFAHEYIHAWNGKFAQPKDHWTPTPNTPIQSTLLWVYEGQTEFWGRVIGARSGLRSMSDTLDALALDAAAMSHRPGRSWKSLADSSLGPVVMPGGSGVNWSDWQRRKDYYTEGVLLWLDVDGILRANSNGKYGMDDFAGRFFAVKGKTEKRYTLNDICSSLAELTPYDWHGYFQRRVYGNSDAGILDGLTRAGYRLVYTDVPSRYVRTALQGEAVPDFSYSLGMDMNDKGVLRAVGWGGPAFQAGLAPGMRIVAVDGRPFSKNSLADAVSGRSPEGIRLDLEDDGVARAVTVQYSGGMRYPTLERIPDTVDRLTPLLRSR